MGSISGNIYSFVWLSALWSSCYSRQVSKPHPRCSHRRCSRRGMCWLRRGCCCSPRCFGCSQLAFGCSRWSCCCSWRGCGCSQRTFGCSWWGCSCSRKGWGCTLRGCSCSLLGCGFSWRGYSCTWQQIRSHPAAELSGQTSLVTASNLARLSWWRSSSWEACPVKGATV